MAEGTGGISEETGSKEIQVTQVKEIVPQIETENQGDQTAETVTEEKTTPPEEQTVE
jgi:hypothetical protein